MKRIIIGMVVVFAFSTAAISLARPIENYNPRAYISNINKSPLRTLYIKKYRAVKHKFGKRAPGRNIVKDGVKNRHIVREATNHEIAVSIRVLRGMLHPPIPPKVTSSGTYNGAAPSPNYSGYSGAMPACTWVGESGGNYHAVNPSSGAGGKYQFLPSTWAALGGKGAPQDAAPAIQEALARKLYAGGAGASNWVNC